MGCGPLGYCKHLFTITTYLAAKNNKKNGDLLIEPLSESLSPVGKGWVRGEKLEHFNPFP